VGETLGAVHKRETETSRVERDDIKVAISVAGFLPWTCFLLPRSDGVLPSGAFAGGAKGSVAIVCSFGRSVDQ
jgi:hypothetical protein